MSRCEITGKRPMVKNLVSHSNRKTKTKCLPNVQIKRIFSSALNEMVKLQLAVSTMRSMEHSGGFDKFILNSDLSKMSARALKVRARIARKLRG